MTPREGTPSAAGFHRLLPAVLAAAVLAGAGSLSGCSEDILGKNTAIDGRVYDAVTEDPIFGVNIALVYQPILPSSAPGPVAAAGGEAPHGAPSRSRLETAAAVLKDPYPNPGVGPFSIPVTVDGPTPLRVEVLATFGGVAGNIALVFNGTVTQDTTLTWDGLDNFSEETPNGLYTVRMTSPPGSAAVDKKVLVNRSSSLVTAQGVYNIVSGPDGDYLLVDLPVGETFVATGVSGQVLGTGRLDDQVTLAFRDPDYVDKDEVVLIGKGDTVTQNTYLNRKPAAAAVLP
jgi:hypothetical protein